MKSWKAAILIGVVLCFASALAAQQVKTDYDRNANFAQYKTYSWEQVKTKDQLDVDRIKSAVNAELTAKGWTQVDSGGDVSVIAMEITHEQQTLNTFYDGFGGGWVGGASAAAASAKQPQRQTRTRWELWSSTCSTPRRKIYYGEEAPATHFPTTPARTSKTRTRAWTNSSRTFPQDRKNSGRTPRHNELGISSFSAGSHRIVWKDL